MYLASYKKISIAAALIFALSGCSVSPAVDAVSWSVDGISYFLTGKSMTDHAVSAAAGKDCAMVRVVKARKVCVPRDEDVAGDRLVFQFDNSSWTVDPATLVADGDPLSVNPAVAEIVEPLGNSVQVEARSTAVAAVSADTIPIHAMMRVEAYEARKPVVSALIKDKAAMPMASPDRATRLWLPVD